MLKVRDRTLLKTGIRNAKYHSHAEDAVTRSGPFVAERVGIALCDVVRGEVSLSVSVSVSIDDGCDKGGSLNSDN